MTAEATLKKIEQYIKEYVSDKEDDTLDDGDEFFDAQDMFGGNFDDAYEGGVRHGKTELANDIQSFIDEMKS